MMEKFERVFEEVAIEKNLAWYELFDSEEFDEVEKRIVNEFGVDVLDSDEYIEWISEMAMDL